MPQVLKDPYYPYAWVYGNLIVNDAKQKVRTYSAKLIHWGGDNDPRYFRLGTLFFYNNTVLMRMDKLDYWYSILFDIPAPEQKVSARANIIAMNGSTQLRVGQESGLVSLDDVNWISRDWTNGGPGGNAKLTVTGRLIEGRDASVGPDGRPLPGAPGRDQGALGAMAWPAGISADNLRVTHEFMAPAGLAPRAQRGAAMDLGAFESQ